MSDSFDPRVARRMSPVWPVPVDPDGLRGPTRGQAAGPSWRRSSRGLFVPASADGSLPEQRIVEQAARLGPGAAVTGWAALWLAGAAYFDGRSSDGRLWPVPLVDPGRQLRGGPAALASRAAIAHDEVTLRFGIRTARVPRALLDEVVLRAELRAAVVAVDMVAAAELASIRRLQEYADARAGSRGAALLRRALALADERSRSPQESRLRLVWMLDAGLPRPLCNTPVYDRDGRLIGIPDLLDPVAGMVGEYDGADHRRRSRRFRDLRREERFRDHGLEYFTAVAGDLLDRDALVARMISTRGRARWLPAEDRAWTTRRRGTPYDVDESA